MAELKSSGVCAGSYGDSFRHGKINYYNTGIFPLGGESMFFPPIPLIRQQHIMKKLAASGAFDAEHAVTFQEAGVINPHAFCAITKKLLKSGMIVSCLDGRYYIGSGKTAK